MRGEKKTNKEPVAKYHFVKGQEAKLMQKENHFQTKQVSNARRVKVFHDNFAAKSR